jgi:hypothetical protein
MGGHHLIMGELTDFLTGRPLPDTHDERYRQRIARLLVDQRAIDARIFIPACRSICRSAGNRRVSDLDFVVRNEGRIGLLIKYAPGSLVTRHQVAYAAAMLLAPYTIPFSIVTNGEDAHWLDNTDRRLLSRGLNDIWDSPHPERQASGPPSTTPGHTPAG